MPNQSSLTNPPRADRHIELRAMNRVAVPLLLSLASAVCFLMLFGWLAEEVFEGDLLQFDTRTRAVVHQLASPLLTNVLERVTYLGSSGVLSVFFAIAMGIFLAAKLRRPAVWLLIAMGGALVLDVTLKLAFHRSRPLAFFGSVPHSYSFPSGHALGSFCFYGVIAGLLCARIKSRLVRVLIWSATAILVAAIGFSRIYLGVHYPTDVVAGYLAGAVWVSTLLLADRFRLKKASRVAS